ncbi:connector enhancer of kinase suppressor of ras 1 isoform X3 [Pipistrellus kuhlii]|uniref:connector enhancer of kinase suppressor of ras 1 isoform X3 n=1 Tax=Pipistrellus kuhlii TaxID=59472 RepID=UPI001E26F348|nr:connector enhancer of kinase suppressor of ras 1 isoform X3 [Pipistrellus kuhlii]
MEPVETWTPGKVAAWLRAETDALSQEVICSGFGIEPALFPSFHPETPSVKQSPNPMQGLDDCLQDYCFEDWELPGKYLLQLCPRSLEALAVRPLGHQELILEGVEQLRALSSGLQTENLRSLTERLLEGTRVFQSSVRGRLGGCAEPPADVLSAAVELVREARTLLFWLNRYLFTHLNDFSACQEIGELCRKLGLALQEDSPAAERESQVLRICSHMTGICHSILSCSPQELLEQRAVLEHVQLEDPLGLEIHTTSNCLHFVSQVGTQVGWPHKNVVRELFREPAKVSLVLKKVPVPETPPQSPPQALGSPQPLSSSQPRVPSLALGPLSPRTTSEDIFAFNLTSNPSPGSSPASTDSASLDPEPLPVTPAPPATLPTGGAETPEPLEDKSPVRDRKKSKGVATRLSRRRVSCRELGQPDCDGWLLLRKVPGGFMGPRWRRCWFVLKRHKLYWYRQPQDEKAEGLINVSNYSLESGHDQKKKYVFQLTHDVYKPFIFAADTLADLSMWVRHLITCISKYQSPGQAAPPREEDCYSETEVEDLDDEAGSRSASPSQGHAGSPPRGDASPAATPMQGSPRTSFGLPTDSSEGTLEGMVRGLRQGGVSLLGQPQPLTHEQWRSSFMRRNRDPQLNERAHRVRALQSTLKRLSLQAKLQELQALEEVLGDAELTGEKFRRWKEQNQELYSEGLGAWGVEQAESGPQAQASGSREHSARPPSPDSEEHSHLCHLTPESNLRP